VAAAAFQRLKQGLTTPASEVEIKFGLKMTAEAGVVISSVGGEVNFEVTLTWKQE
jgi:Trypsin-co-occurring domain 1